MNPNEGARIPNDPAREWGMEFVAVINNIGQPPPNETVIPIEGEEARILGAQPGEAALVIGEFQPIPREWGGAIMSRLIESLRKASITDAFKAYIAELVSQYLTMEPFRFVLGFDFIFRQCGISPQDDSWGIFDPNLSQSMEKKAIRDNYPFRRLFGDPEEHFRKMYAWVAGYKATYAGEDPLEGMPNI